MKPSHIFVTSLISHRNQSPRIQIEIDDLKTQMDTDSAVKIALDILQVAAGSHADAFLYHYMSERVFKGDKYHPALGTLISDFREYRDKLQQDFLKFQEENEE